MTTLTWLTDQLRILVNPVPRGILLYQIRFEILARTSPSADANSWATSWIWHNRLLMGHAGYDTIDSWWDMLDMTISTLDGTWWIWQYRLLMEHDGYDTIDSWWNMLDMTQSTLDGTCWIWHYRLLMGHAWYDTIDSWWDMLDMTQSTLDGTCWIWHYRLMGHAGYDTNDSWRINYFWLNRQLNRQVLKINWLLTCYLTLDLLTKIWLTDTLGQDVLICTHEGKNSIVEVILLPNLWICSLAYFIPEIY